jgi:PAS domain S-box-containing protein
MLVMYGGDAGGAAELERLGFASYMCVPMHGRDQVLGTVTFATGDPARRFDEADLALAEELARRTAVAVENALLFREAEERGRAARVLAAVADGVFLVDAQGMLRLWNPAAEAITGLRAADVLNLPVAEVIPGWDMVSSRIGGGADAGTAAGRAETVPLEIQGRELWLSISGVGFADGTVYAFRDLTQERALEELKGEFVSTVSHELRTPLAAIYGAAMTLQRPDIGDDTAANVRLLDVIARESERLATIVNDILLASRLDSNAVRVAIESFDAGELAESVLESADVNRPEGITLSLLAPPELPLVAGDPEKTRQVLVNLVDNALKYSPDGGRVEIELSAGPSSVRFAVHDEGLGIAPAEQRRIFEKFYRLDPNMTRGVGGTGLGLYICRELVDRMQGRIWVGSPRAGGKGSTFAFELPLGTVPK